MRSKTLGTISGETDAMTTSVSQIRKYSDRKLEMKMPLDHELQSIVNDLGPLKQSSFEAQHRPADQAASADGVPRLSENSLIPCVYIALMCPHCGHLRQALAELPDTDAVVCPVCARNCRFVLLGSGLTRKKLPFHEVHSAEQTRRDHRSEEKTDSS
jgi:hypothetical protein